MLKQVIQRNLEWFKSSGVMFPADGSWGVAERIAVRANNAAMERILTVFPAFTEFDGGCIIEPRRADCNFQTAWIFLTAGQLFPGCGYEMIGKNIIDFLYCRSGLLARSSEEGLIPGCWNWSHITRKPAIWYDDESWCLLLQHKIADDFPELDRKYQMHYWADRLAGELYQALASAEPSPHWNGNREMPHFTALAAMALAGAATEETAGKYQQIAKKFYSNLNCPNTSEHAYAMLGAINCARKFDREFFLAQARKHADAIIAKIDPETGIMPAEHHEAPQGSALADMIYTLNWSLIGMRELALLLPEYRKTAEQLINFVCKIQDDTPSSRFNGCWRGMYDVSTQSWGGGDHHEGGANSIYTGWTNAPICSALLMEYAGRSMFETSR
ncbi:MAG: hypothetical protein E7042_04675 [Lentisphaerae bacterium]|nr:hypothetical protein [Lentisphaerota bacterium]